ncbi:MAG: DUF5643 domain-containing protein, partial [Eubacteriales bacterium]|nr:DUF5643 domain-containing protein [Eubacteriales bacterium]
IFYTIRGEAGKNYFANMRFMKADGSYYDEFYLISGVGQGVYANDFRKHTIDFGEYTVPNRLRLIVDATDSRIMGENPILATFTFDLTIDPDFVQKPKVYALDQSFTIEGQSFTVTTVEVYPMSLRVNLEADPSNTKWIRALRCYAEDERENRYELINEGLAAEQSEDSPMMNGFRLESPYFGGGKRLTLYITGAVWLDKDAPQTKVDLEAGTAENLPDGVILSRVAWEEGQCRIIFSTPDAQKNGFRDQYGSPCVFESEWKYSLDDTRKEWFYGMKPSTPEELTEEYTIKEEYPIVETHLDYQGYIFKREYTTVKVEMPSVVYLTPQYTSSSDAAKPIKMKIK